MYHGLPAQDHGARPGLCRQDQRGLSRPSKDRPSSHPSFLSIPLIHRLSLQDQSGDGSTVDVHSFGPLEGQEVTGDFTLLFRPGPSWPSTRCDLMSAR